MKSKFLSISMGLLFLIGGTAQTNLAQKTASLSADVAKTTSDLQKQALSTETSPEALRGLDALSKTKAIIERMRNVGSTDDGKQWALIGAALAEAAFYADLASKSEYYKGVAADYLNAVTDSMEKGSERTKLIKITQGIKGGTLSSEQAVEGVVGALQGLNSKLDGSAWWYFNLGTSAGRLTAQAALKVQGGIKEQVDLVGGLARSAPEGVNESMIGGSLKRITRLSGKVGYSENDFAALSLAADGVTRAVVAAATGGGGAPRQ